MRLSYVRNSQLRELFLPNTPLKQMAPAKQHGSEAKNGVKRAIRSQTGKKRSFAVAERSFRANFTYSSVGIGNLKKESGVSGINEASQCLRDHKKTHTIQN